MQLLPAGSSDEAPKRYIDSLGAANSKRTARSQLERAARALIGWAAPARPTRIGAKSVHIMLDRVPWSSVSPSDCARVRDELLEELAPRSAAAVCTALRGALRASSMDRGQLWECERALRIERQQANGRTVASVVAEWNLDLSSVLGS